MSNQSQKSPLQENLAQEEEQQQQEDQNLQEPSQEPPGGGGDERNVATLLPSAQKTSIARNGPVLKPHAATSLAPQKEVADGTILASLGLLSYDDHEEGDTSPDEEEFIFKTVSNLKPKSLTAKNFASPRLPLPLGTPAKRRLFENSANDGASQGKEKKIKDKVHGEDGEVGGGGGDENPRDDSASI